jgi:hypothetical protein
MRHMAALLMLAACAAPRAVPPELAGVPAQPAKQAPLLPVPERAGAPSLPHLVVRARVAGHPTLLVVDTGAQASVLDATFAAAAGLRVTQSLAGGRDAEGRSIELQRVEQPAVELEGLGAVPDQPWLVVAFPDSFGERGIGGLLSPQALVTGQQAVVLDFARRRLSLGLSAEAPQSATWLSLGQHAWCRGHSGGVEARALALSGFVDGRPTLFELDSGADRSDVIARSDAGAAARLHPQLASRSYQTAGGSTASEVREHVAIRASEWSAALNLDIVGEPRDCGFEGRIGLDVLHACVVVIREGASSVRCARARP